MGLRQRAEATVPTYDARSSSLEVPAKALDSPDYVCGGGVDDGAAEADAVLQDADLPYATLDELGLCIVVERTRSVVREARRRGKKRAHESTTAAVSTTPAATDAPT